MGKNTEMKHQIESLKNEIISSFNNGQSCKLIQKDLNLQCHETTILNYLKEWGVDTTHKHNPEWWNTDASRNDQIFQLKQSGKTHKEIADLFSISVGRVTQILKKFD
jgi:hypothetical protein